MLPLSRFVEALEAYKAEVGQNFDELIMAADLIAKKTNTITREDNGSFYVQATGTLDECINTLSVMLNKLKKIKEQQE